MGRPWDWSLLGGTDPAPGDLDDVFRAQRAWAQNVSLLDEAAQLLRGPDISGEGATVDAARELLSRDIALVELYRGDCVSCAEGLAGWLGQ
ncbi:hypothetical protein ODZ83_03450 [Acaricomes phytoseiuli]|uniref:hypothetical protein n=1 Tax=Acaricomes phytoseiuli TaxID=291968 RepID=UPI00039B9152|nr:hypothetical protein [Acaricomes phytoseiuli]MCW1249255.1 hypothetical protein [Acaricomes phytoseiuli]